MFNQLLTTIMKKNLWILAAALLHDSLLAKRDIVIEQPVSDNDFESPDGRLIIQLGGIETRIGASVGVTRAPLDKLYDEQKALLPDWAFSPLPPMTLQPAPPLPMPTEPQHGAIRRTTEFAEQYTGSSNRLAQTRRFRCKAGRFGE